MLLVTSGLLLSGCGLVAKPADMVTEQPTKNYTGTISSRNGMFLMSTTDGKMVEMTSKKVDLKLYEGKKITVTGEYSGTTLYVDTVQ